MQRWVRPSLQGPGHCSLGSQVEFPSGRLVAWSVEVPAIPLQDLQGIAPYQHHRLYQVTRLYTANKSSVGRTSPQALTHKQAVTLAEAAPPWHYTR